MEVIESYLKHFFIDNCLSAEKRSDPATGWKKEDRQWFDSAIKDVRERAKRHGIPMKKIIKITRGLEREKSCSPLASRLLRKYAQNAA